MANHAPDPDPIHCERCTKPVDPRDVLSLMGKLLCTPCYDDEFRDLRTAERAGPRRRNAQRVSP